MATNTGHKYISHTERDGYFIVSLPLQHQNGHDQQRFSRTTLEAAIQTRNEALGFDPDRTVNIERGELSFDLPGEEMSDDELWQFVTRYQAKSQARDAAREWVNVPISGTKPIGIAWLSDIHFGGPHTDYARVQRDTDLIINTPGLYAEFHGDLWDNWIIGKLQAIQRQQFVQHKQELRLGLSWLDKISSKLIWVVSGNHDMWIEKLAGVDLLREYQSLKGLRYIYDQNEVRVCLSFSAGVYWNIITRHKWKGSSIYNPTHGIERSWRFGTHEFDIGVGGHTHEGTFARPFKTREGTLSWAIMTGTYKRRDKYGEELGVSRTSRAPSGCSIFFPDGRHEFFYDILTASQFLGYVRGA